MPKDTAVLRRKMQNNAVKMRTVDMQVDTVNMDMAGGTAAYYYNGDFDSNPNTITINFIKDKGIVYDYATNGTTLLHEQKHRDNYLQGMYAYAVSPEQAYKRTMHDEISANMTELIALRDEYIKTGDISVFDKEPQFGFYKEAIAKGEINPNSNNSTDFDKDMRLIFNGTREMWMNNQASKDSYVNLGLYYWRDYADSEGKYAAYWDENYKNSLKIAYNIGGVDFTKYMDKDVEIPHEADAKMMEDIEKGINSMESYHLSAAELFQKSGLPAYDGSISLSEYKRLLQHQAAINKAFPSVWHGDNVYNTQEFLQYIRSDKFEENLQYMYENDPEYRKEFPDVNSFKDSVIKNIKDRLVIKWADMSDNYFDKIVEYQAQEYAKTGKEFPADNKENYQKKLNELYCGSYDLIGFCFLYKLSDKADEIVKQSQEGFTDRIKRGLENIHYRCTHIVDKDGETHDVGLWGKIIYKLGEAKESVSNWMTGYDPNISENNNLPTHPVNAAEPEYRQWENEDGSRVSAVQYREIPDMNQAFILQPTLSYDVENDANSAIIVPMDHTVVAEQIQKDQHNAQIYEHNLERQLRIAQPSVGNTIGNPLQETNNRVNLLNENFRRNMKQHGF